MYLKTKELNEGKLILDLTKGIYTIGVEIPEITIGDTNIYKKSTIKAFERYYSSLGIDEVARRFNQIYDILIK